MYSENAFTKSYSFTNHKKTLWGFLKAKTTGWECSPHRLQITARIISRDRRSLRNSITMEKRKGATNFSIYSLEKITQYSPSITFVTQKGASIAGRGWGVCETIFANDLRRPIGVEEPSAAAITAHRFTNPSLSDKPSLKRRLKDWKVHNLWYFKSWWTLVVVCLKLG